MAGQLSLPAARQQRNGLPGRIEAVCREKICAHGADAHCPFQRMPYIGCVYPTFPEPAFFEREQAVEMIDHAADLRNATLPPGPDLRGNKIEDRDSETLQTLRHPQMEIGAIGQECRDRAVLFGIADQLAKFAVDSGQMRDHLGQSHYRQSGRVHYGTNAQSLQSWSCATVEIGAGQAGLQIANHTGGVQIARSLTGGHQELHDSLSGYQSAACGRR